MYEIKMWAFGIIAVSFISCIIRLVSPSSSKSSPVMIAVNLFIVLNLIHPLASFAGYTNSFVVTQEISAQSFDVDAMYEESVKSSIEKLIHDKLQALGIKPNSILIDITVVDEQLNVDKISITLADEDASKKTLIRDQLVKYLGLPVEITTQQQVK